MNKQFRMSPNLISGESSGHIYTKFGEDQMRIKYFLSILVFERLRDSILLDGLKLMLEWSPGHIYQIWCRLYGKCVFYEYFSTGEVA